MAWALQFDGVNDYATIATTINETSTSWRLEWRAALTDNTSNTNRIIAKTSGSTDYIRTRSSSTEQLVMEIDNTTYNIIGGTRSTVNGDMSDYILTCNGSQLEYFVDGVSIGSVAGFPVFKNMEVIGRGGSSYFNGSLEYFKYFDTSSGDVLKFNFDATTSSHSSGTPILSELVVGNNATGINMPTDGSAWVDLGGSGISITGATANYNYAGIVGSVDLTGEVIVTGSTGSYNYTGITATIELGAEIIVTGQTASYNYTGIDGSVELTGLITVLGQTANYDYDGIAADITLQGSIIVSGSTANYDYNALNATIILQGPITINPKNIVRVKRQLNTIRVKRNSNIIRVR
jgi:hypothetical protein